MVLAPLLLLHGPIAGAWLAPGQLCDGLGMGLISGPLTSVVLGRVDRKFAGAASGLLAAIQQFSGAIGVAAIGALYIDRVAATGSHLDGFVWALASILLLLMVCFGLARKLGRQ